MKTGNDQELIKPELIGPDAQRSGRLQKSYLILSHDFNKIHYIQYRLTRLCGI